MRAWMVLMGLLLVVGTMGCEDKPSPVAKRSHAGPELGQNEAVREIKKLGGRVEIDEDGSVVSVRLASSQLTDTSLAYLKELTTLEVLFINSDEVTDAGLEHLKGLANLRLLQIQNTKVTDEGIKKLQEALPNCKIEH